MYRQAASSSQPWQAAARGTLSSRIGKLWQSRWLVLVASLWLQACSGVGYAFGGYSPLVKSTLGYSQQQITMLGIAKDLGANIGLVAGFLSESLPTWSLVAIGALHNLVGYGWLWLIVTGHAPILPMWAVCILILVGTNGETYLNTVALVTNVSNFPKSRGHVSGLLKGFAGLCSAMFAQIYLTFFAPDQAAYLLIIAAGPTIISFLTMFVIRRIKSKEEGKLSDSIGFSFVYADSLVIAAYLMGVLILQDVTNVSFHVRLIITILLLVMVGLPLATPMVLWVAAKRTREEKKEDEDEDAERGSIRDMEDSGKMKADEVHVVTADAERGSVKDMEDTGIKSPLMKGYKREEQAFNGEEKSHGFCADRQGERPNITNEADGKGINPYDPEQEHLGIIHSVLHEIRKEESIEFTSADLGQLLFAGGSRAESFTGSVATSELEDEKPDGLDNLPDKERENKVRKIRRMIVLAMAEGAVRVKKRRRRPHLGEDFTLTQALVKADFWLLFVALLCGAGTGMAAIDNMGQISQSQGYANPSVFVSMTSIFNFLGRLLGGYFSEILVRRYVLPRSWALCVAQGLMGVGHFIIAMGWPKALYVGTLLVGGGYGSHWGIVPPMISEIFGIKRFGLFYNFYTIATPAGVLFFSGFLAGRLYDIEAARQSALGLRTISNLGHQENLMGSTVLRLGMAAPVLAGTATSCDGAVCFRLSFLIMMAVCMLGVLMAAILSVRTRRVYKSLYGTKFTLLRC